MAKQIDSLTLQQINILLVVDHKLSREGLSMLIQSFSTSITIYEASDSQEALNILKGNTKIDIVVLDIQTAYNIWFNTIKRIKKLDVNRSLLALIHFNDESAISYLLQLGTNGLLLKGSITSELREAIFGVIEKGYFYSGLVLEIIQKNISNRDDHTDLKISSRECQVMSLLTEGIPVWRYPLMLQMFVERAIMQAITYQKRLGDVVRLWLQYILIPQPTN